MHCFEKWHQDSEISAKVIEKHKNAVSALASQGTDLAPCFDIDPLYVLLAMRYIFISILAVVAFKLGFSWIVTACIDL